MKDFKEFPKLVNWSDVFIRTIVGIVFITAGYGKLFGVPGIQGFTGMLQGIGIPAAGFFAVLVGIIELIGGIWLILGYWTRIPATLLAIIIIVAIVTVRLKGPFADMRLDLLVLAALTRYIGTRGWCPIKDRSKKAKS